MKRLRRRQQEGGFVLLVVLALLVMLTLVASLAYQRASDQVQVSNALRRQAVAQDRAIAGMQRGIADVSVTPRPPYLAGLAASPVCMNADPLQCPPIGVPGVLVVDNTPLGLDIDQGGGSLYTVNYWRWQPPGALGVLVIISSTGFHGNDPGIVAGATRMSSTVLIEVSEGQANPGGCVGYCGGGLE